MSDPRAHQSNPRQDRSTERVVVDFGLVARAVEINEAIAAEFAAPTDDPRDNPAVTRLEELGEELGFETETIVHEVTGRAKQIFWDIHLTGVERVGGPPWPVGRGSIEAGGLATACRRQRRSRCAPSRVEDQVAVADRVVGDGELQDAVEDESAAARAPAVKRNTNSLR